MTETDDKIITLSEFMAAKPEAIGDPDAMAKLKKMEDAMAKLKVVGERMLDGAKLKADMDARMLRVRYDALIRAGFRKADALELIKGK
jgi:hypothetical protein